MSAFSGDNLNSVAGMILQQGDACFSLGTLNVIVACCVSLEDGVQLSQWPTHVSKHSPLLLNYSKQIVVFVCARGTFVR